MSIERINLTKSPVHPGRSLDATSGKTYMNDEGSVFSSGKRLSTPRMDVSTANSLTTASNTMKELLSRFTQPETSTTAASSTKPGTTVTVSSPQTGNSTTSTAVKQSIDSGTMRTLLSQLTDLTGLITELMDTLMGPSATATTGSSSTTSSADADIIKQVDGGAGFLDKLSSDNKIKKSGNDYSISADDATAFFMNMQLDGGTYKPGETNGSDFEIDTLKKELARSDELAKSNQDSKKAYSPDVYKTESGLLNAFLSANTNNDDIVSATELNKALKDGNLQFKIS